MPEKNGNGTRSTSYDIVKLAQLTKENKELQGFSEWSKPIRDANNKTMRETCPEEFKAEKQARDARITACKAKTPNEFWQNRLLIALRGALIYTLYEGKYHGGRKHAEIGDRKINSVEIAKAVFEEYRAKPEAIQKLEVRRVEVATATAKA